MVYFTTNLSLKRGTNFGEGDMLLGTVRGQLERLLAGGGEAILRRFVEEEIAGLGQDPRREMDQIRARLVEIDRMLRFAAELKQPAIIYGGRETYRPQAAELLKKSGVPVLVSMRWPEKGRDVNPEDEDSFREALGPKVKVIDAAALRAGHWT